MPAYRGFDADGENELPALPAQPGPKRESAPIGKQCRRVLVLLDMTARGEAILRQATGVAAKNRAVLIAVHVLDRLPLFESDGPCGYFLAEERLFFAARATARKLDLFLARYGASWAESKVLYGRIDAALAELARRWRPDLVVADERAMRNGAIARGLAATEATTQLLTLERAGRKWNAVALRGNPDPRGGEDCASRAGEKAKSTARGMKQRSRWMRTALLGVATAFLYWLMFANEGLVLQASAKGRWYSVIPLVVAFVFCFVHGAFTARFWDALGVKANPRR